MKKIFHLSTCDTCKRIIKEINPPENFELQEIKTEVISEEDIAKMHELAGSYESLFSKRAQLYRKRGLQNEDLSETDYKNLILEHYTFLKRPVIINDDEIFIGNAKKTVAAAKISIHE